jgi:acyl-CoA dehydrogenase
VPGAPELRSNVRQLTRLCAAFAFSADVAMLFLGGDLKRREKLSARLGDILSQLYIASTVLKRYEDDGRPRADLPVVKWALEDSLIRIQDAFYGVFENFPSGICGWMLRVAVFPWGKSFAAPRDYLGRQIAKLLLESSPTRERLTANVFVMRHENDPVGRLELAMQSAPAGEATETTVKANVISGLTEHARVAAAVEKGIISAAEAAQFQRFSELRKGCIMVDDFPHDIGRSQATREPANVTALGNSVSHKTAA